MLALADELKNISRACQVAGISRTHFYDIKDVFERYGRDGLAPKERRRPRMPNETPPELVTPDPDEDDGRVPDVLVRAGLAAAPADRGAGECRPGPGCVGPGGAGQALRPLLWLERRVAAHGGPLTESVLKLLRQHAHQTLDPQGQIEAPSPGLSRLPGHLRRRHAQGRGPGLRPDLHRCQRGGGSAKLYLSKVPMTAVDLLYERVLPFYEAQGVVLEAGADRQRPRVP